MSTAGAEVQALHLSAPVAGLTTGRRHGITIRREVVPIIFVPGIMGSRLTVRGVGKVWDPDDKGFMLKAYGFLVSNAARKKLALIGDASKPRPLVPFTDDEGHNRKKFGRYGADGAPGADPDHHANLRGWGGVAWSLYGGFLTLLQERGYAAFDTRTLRFGSKWPGIESPVYAFGYNWTASNRDAGAKLRDFIGKTIRHYQGKGRECRQVILVTHSMGGLVARSACMLHGAARMVLGVVHGVQPATGSAAAYWRMQAGFPRPDGPDILGVIASRVLGVDGREVTALLGNMPGGLELLPNQHYTTDGRTRTWLRWTGDDGAVAHLPRSGDPYQEIYLNRTDPWRLVRSPGWLIPEVVRDTASTDRPLTVPERAAWTGFEQRIAQVKQLHQDLGLRQHPRSYHFYGTREETPATISFDTGPHLQAMTVGLVSRITRHRPSSDIRYRQVARACTDAEGNTGEYTVYTPGKTPDERVTWAPAGGVQHVPLVRHRMRRPEEDGDGTVPTSSGSALCPQAGTKRHEAHGGYEHDKAYEDSRAREFVFDVVCELLETRVPDALGPQAS